MQGQGRDEEAGQDWRPGKKLKRGRGSCIRRSPVPSRGEQLGRKLQRLTAEPSPGAMAERTEGDLLRCSVQQTCAPHPYDERLPGRTGGLGQELRVWRLDPGRGPLLAVREPEGGPRNAGGGSLDSHRGQEMQKGRGHHGNISSRAPYPPPQALGRAPPRAGSPTPAAPLCPKRATHSPQPPPDGLSSSNRYPALFYQGS